MINKFRSFFYGQNKKFFNTILFVAMVIGLSFLLAPNSAEAAARTASVSGNWNSTATWGGSSVPVAGDTVTINSGITVTVTANAACSSIAFTTGTNGTTASININSGILLAVSGNVTITRPGTNNSNVINVGSGTLTVGGALALSGTTGNRTSTLNINTGTVTVTGNITSAGTASQIIFSGAGILNAGGTFMSGTTGTFTPDGGTINYNANGAQTVGVYTYNNLKFSGSGAKSMAAGISVTSNLSIATTGTATASVEAGQNLDVGTLTLGGLGRINGTWGSTSSSATNQNNTYFAATTGILTVATDTRASQSTLTAVATPSTVVYGSTSALSSIGGSGTGAVTYSAGASTGCSILGTTLSVTDANGTCDITATKAGDTSYFSADSASLPITLSKKTLTVTGITASNKIYDQTTDATLNTGSATLVGVVGGDSITLDTTSAVGTFANANIGTGKTVTISGLTISGAQATNYTLTQPTTTANITAKALTVSGITASDKIYNQSASATIDTISASLVGVISGDTVNLNTGSASGTFANANVGTGKTVTISGLTISGASSGNYSLTQPTTTASITAKNLTVISITANNKIYNQTTSATLNTGSATLVGVMAGDTVTLSTASAVGTFASPDVANGITVTVSGLTISGASATNYSLTQPSTTANITPKALTVSGITASNKIYDQTTDATLNTTSAALVGVISGDTVDLNTGFAIGTFANANIGTGKTVTVSGLTISGASFGNYSLTQPSTTANITVKNLTVSGITANDKEYSGNNSATLNTGSASLVGVISGDTVNLNTASATGVFASVNVGTGITVTISGLTISGASATNYSLTQPTTTASITPKPITVTAAAKTKIFGASDPAFTYTSSDLGASFTGSLTRDAGENVGTYAITQGTLSAGANYAITYVGANLTITAKSITVTAAAKTKQYGDSDPTLTYTSSDPGASFTGSLTRDAGENIGTYAITQGTLSAGANYNITYVGANLTITIKTITVSGITADNKIYDRTTDATLNTASASLVGVVTGDTVDLNTGSVVGTFANANIGTDKTVTITGLTISGASAGNYSLTQPTATASITAKELTVTGITADDKVYNGNTTATLNKTSAALVGVITGDSITLNTTSAVGTFASADVGVGITVTISGLTISGTASGNYSLTQPTTIASILNPVPTTTSINPVNKIAGDLEFNLTVNGTNFTTSSEVNFNGTAKATTFASSTQLTAVIPASDINTAGSFSVTVINPAPGGGTSNAQTFTVDPVPTSQLALNDVTSMVAGERAAYTVTRQDNLGVPVTVGTTRVYLYSNSLGAHKKFYNAASGGAVVTFVDITNGNSTANAWYYDETPGSYTITATDATPSPDGATGLIDATDSLTVTSGVATQFSLNSPGSLIAGNRASYEVTRKDSFNNLVTTGETIVYFYSTSAGVNKKFYDAATNGNIVTSVTITDGASIANIWYYDETPGTYTITASDTTPSPDGANGIIDDTDSLQVTAGATTQFTINDVVSITAGERGAYTITRLDSFGNLATTGSDTVYLHSTSIGANKKFFDLAVGGNVITSIVIGGGNSTANVWYYDELAGTYTITASDSQSVPDSTGIVDATDSLVVGTGALAQLSVNDQTSMTAGTRVAYTVTRKDQFGNLITLGSTVVNLSTSGVNGNQKFYNDATAGNQISSIFIADGNSTVDVWYYDELASNVTVTMSHGSLEVSDAVDSLIVNPATVSQFLLNDPAIMMTAGTRLGYTVTRKDSFNNLVISGDNIVYLYSNSAGPVFFYDASSDGNTISSVTITNGNSQANFWYYDEAPGTPMITASDAIGTPDGTTGIIDATDYVTVDSAPITATRFVILNPTDGTVDAPITVTVQAQDDSGNIDTTYQSDVTILAGGSASGGGLVDISNGVGTINISDTVAQTVNLSLSDTQLTNLNVASTQNVVFAPGVVRQFIINDPGDLVAGGRAAYTVARFDQYNNLVTTGSNAVYLYSNSTGASNKFYNQATDGSIITSLNITNGNSQASFWYYDDKVGNWSIVVSDHGTAPDGDTGIHDTTDPLAVTPGAVFRFILNNPGDMSANTRLGYTVSREDQFGNAVTSGTTNVNLSSNSTGAHSFYDAVSAGSVITQVTISNSSSTANFWYFDGTAGTWIITASNNALGIVEATDSVTVSSVPITATRFVILPPGNALVGASVIVTIEAQDDAGNIDTTYQQDVTLVTDGSATGGGLVSIVNGVGTKTITDTVEETVNLSLSDTATTTLNLSSTQSIVFSKVSTPTSGGGGVVIIVPVEVAPTSNFVVSGKVYPKAVILVTDKSSTQEQVATQTVTASTAGTFNLSVPSDIAGVHIYGVTVKDPLGRLSQTKIFSADFTKIDEIIRNIFMPPTIDVARSVVTRGDFVKVIGYANPNTRLRIQIDNDISYETKSDAQGAYTILINTARLDLGIHGLQARQQDPTTKKYSDPSLLRNFLVSSLSVPKADLNGDGKINATDLSMFTALYKKQDKTVDLNGDGKVDTSDLSIFLRAVK
jgi:hypothetical protein